MEMNKLVMAGHSMGGATALVAAESDPRIKLALVHDPWINIIKPKILYLEKIYCKYV